MVFPVNVRGSVKRRLGDSRPRGLTRQNQLAIFRLENVSLGFRIVQDL